MIYLSKGQLKKLAQRTGLFSSARSSTHSEGEIIRLDFEKNLTIVQCTRVETFECADDKNDYLHLCLIKDSEIEQPVVLDLSSNPISHELKVGSILLLQEISYRNFSDLELNGLPEDLDKDILKSKVMVINIFKIIGEEEVEVNNKKEDDFKMLEMIAESDEEEVEVYEKKEDDNKMIEMVVEADEVEEKPTCSIAQLDESKVRSSFTLKLLIEKKSDLRPFVSNPAAKRIRLKLTDGLSSIEMVAFHEFSDVVNSLELNKWYMVKNVDLIKRIKKYSMWQAEISCIWDLRYRKGTEFKLLREPEKKIESPALSLFNQKVGHETAFVAPQKSSIANNHTTRISDLITIKSGSFVNVLGIICVMKDQFIKKFSNVSNKRDITIRNITLVDSSNALVDVAFWGKDAESFNYQVGTVLMLRNVQVTDYAGITLSVTLKSRVFDVTDNTGHDVVALIKWMKSHSKGSPTTLNNLKLKKRQIDSKEEDINPSPSKKTKF